MSLERKTGQSFLERLSNPDPDFQLYLRALAMLVPLGFNFLFVIVCLIAYTITKLTGVGLLAPIVFQPITLLVILLLPYVTVKMLQVYVYFRIKKNIQQNKVNICKEQQ